MRTPNEAKSQKRRSNGDSTREVLLHAAVAIWSDEGIEGITMNGVALRAGKTRGTVYHHFRDRKALVGAAREHLEVLLESLFVDDRRDGGNPLEIVLRLVADNPEFIRSHLRGLLDHGARHNSVARRAIQFFKSLQEKGRLRSKIDPTQAALTVFGLWLAALLSASLGSTAKARERLLEESRGTFQRVVFRALVHPERGEEVD